MSFTPVQRHREQVCYRSHSVRPYCWPTELITEPTLGWFWHPGAGGDFSQLSELNSVQLTVDNSISKLLSYRLNPDSRRLSDYKIKKNTEN